MSTAARKARKRAGIKFVHPTKTPTPLLERAWFAALHPGPPHTKLSTRLMPRSPAKVTKALADRGIAVTKRRHRILGA